MFFWFFWGAKDMMSPFLGFGGHDQVAPWISQWNRINPSPFVQSKDKKWQVPAVEKMYRLA